MSKKSIFLVCLTSVIFIVALLFIPENMVSHMSGLGQPTSYSNKYKMFIAFMIIDIVGSIFWNFTVERFQSLNVVPVLKDKIKTYFSILMLLLLLSLLASSISSILALCILLGGNVLYIAYLILTKK